MLTLVDFIENASQESTLTGEFLRAIENTTPANLSRWFTEKGYNATIDDCTKLLNNKEIFRKGLKAVYGPKGY